MNTLNLDIPYQIKVVGNYVLVETNITGLWKTSFALVCLISITLLPSSHAQDSPQDYLNAHNAARAQVGVAPLSWDTNLANYAQRYANSRIGDCNLVHFGGPYNENIAKSTGDLSGTAAVNLFVSEKADYNYNSNTCAAGKVCGHYTQVVWRSSTRLGCAKVWCNNGGTFIGCNYDPRGNYAGQSE
ncbi:hypothetical protein EV1_034622 [Malus domestica]